MNEHSEVSAIERRKRFLITFAYIIAIIWLISFIGKYALSSLLPFLMAYIVVALLRSVLKPLHEKLRLPYKTTGIILIVLFYLLISFIGVILCNKVLLDLRNLLIAIPQVWNNTLLVVLQRIGEGMTAFFEHFNIELGASLSDIIASLGKNLLSFSTKILLSIGNMAISLPGLLIDTIICVVATAFILLDWDHIAAFIHRQLSGRASMLLTRAGNQLCKTLWQYFRSYGLIVLITFSEIAAGLWLIGVDNPALIGALIALLDILPVIGSGMILIPWSIICFFTGSVGYGIGLSLLYLVVAVVRNIIEPKIVGNQVGLHPLVTLLAMIIGSTLFGGIGLLTLPVATAVAKKMNDDGIISFLK